MWNKTVRLCIHTYELVFCFLSSPLNSPCYLAGFHISGLNLSWTHVHFTFSKSHLSTFWNIPTDRRDLFKHRARQANDCRKQGNAIKAGVVLEWSCREYFQPKTQPLINFSRELPRRIAIKVLSSDFPREDKNLNSYVKFLLQSQMTE